MGNQDTQSLPKKIIGNLVRLAVAGQVKGTMGADGFINRVCKACLVKSIEISVKKDFIAWSAFHIERGLQAYDPFSQGAGFIGADHVHAAEVFNRSKPFDNHLRLSHPFGAMSQVDADDRRQQLRRQPNSQCQGKEEGVQDRPCQVDVDGKDGYHQHQSNFHEEIAKLPYAAFKVRFLRPES